MIEGDILMQELKFYSFKEVMRILGISRNTLYNRLADGKIKGNKFGHQWRFSEKALEDVAADYDVPNTNTSVVPIKHRSVSKTTVPRKNGQRSFRERLKEAGVFEGK